MERHRQAEPDHVPFRVLEPCGLRATKVGDPTDGLEPRGVVVLEPDALRPKVFDRLLEVPYLESHLGVRPRRRSPAAKHPETGAARHLIEHAARILLGWRQPQLVAIKGFRPF